MVPIGPWKSIKSLWSSNILLVKVVCIIIIIDGVLRRRLKAGSPANNALQETSLATRDTFILAIHECALLAQTIVAECNGLQRATIGHTMNSYSRLYNDSKRFSLYEERVFFFKCTTHRKNDHRFYSSYDYKIYQKVTVFVLRLLLIRLYY